MLGDLREGMDRAEYERDGWLVMLQRAQREREKCIDAVNPVQSGAGELQELV